MKILYGICGIGNGHFFRQKPLIDYLILNNHKIIFFSFANSFKLLNKFKTDFKYDNISIVEVDVPYYIGNEKTIDFIKTSQINENISLQKNLKAFADVQKIFGEPDIVISDYEPYSAQLAYAFNKPLITYDQQSKFFSQDVPKEIDSLTYNDEIMRLNMFFPKAHRIASSFFKLKNLSPNKLDIVPPLFRKSILELNKSTFDENVGLVYLSYQNGFNQSLEQIVKLLEQRKEYFYIFTENNVNFISKNVEIHKLNQNIFENTLSRCGFVISNAGHNLLAECTYLKIPIYAMPMNLYEQKLNAKIIKDNNFGLYNNCFDLNYFEFFTKNLQLYKQSYIKNDILYSKDEILNNNIITKLNKYYIL